MNLGNAIKELRKNKKLSQEKLAELAGIRQASLSQIENGKRPGIETLKRISNALQVPESMIYIMGMEKDDVPKNKQILYDELFPIIQSLVMKIGE
jgi:transcriptional regulator with XRE-family HTH domain